MRFVVTVITWRTRGLGDLGPIVEKHVWWMVFFVVTIVMIAVTVITWVLGELTPFVVQTLIAGEKTHCVCLEFLVQSVATHGQCI